MPEAISRIRSVPLARWYLSIEVCASACRPPCHCVFQAGSGGYCGGDRGRSECMKVQVRPSGFDLGLVKVVTEPIRG